MSELPSLVRVKRKRGADPTPDLFLEERSTKRSTIWQFRLQQPHPNEVDGLTTQSNIDQAQADQAEKDASALRASRREFRLAINKDRIHNGASKKRKAQLDAQDIPTFVEATTKKQRTQDIPGTAGTEEAGEDSKPSTALKRPSANAKERQWRAETWKKPASTLSQPANNPPPDRLVDALSRFALEEAARDEAREKPKVTSIPKKPVQRYKDRHPADFAAQNAQKQARGDSRLSNNADVEVGSGDEDDYVYDTYVRTRNPVMLPTTNEDDLANDQVGYLVITEQDQPFWETYFEDDESEKEFETDDEDENAEGYYGADYPEDEVASDDEFDRGAYGYRKTGSDDEQWDSDTGAWSDEEDVMQNPWKKFPWMRDQKNTTGASDDDSDD